MDASTREQIEASGADGNARRLVTALTPRVYAAFAAPEERERLLAGDVDEDVIYGLRAAAQGVTDGAFDILSSMSLPAKGRLLEDIARVYGVNHAYLQENFEGVRGPADVVGSMLWFALDDALVAAVTTIEGVDPERTGVDRHECYLAERDAPRFSLGDVAERHLEGYVREECEALAAEAVEMAETATAAFDRGFDLAYHHDWIENASPAEQTALIQGLLEMGADEQYMAEEVNSGGAWTDVIEQMAVDGFTSTVGDMAVQRAED